MKRVVLVICMMVSIFGSATVNADIYRLESDDEVVSFTDSPNDKRFQLVLKEQSSRGVLQKKGKGEPNAAGKSEIGSAGRNLPVDGVITSTTGLRSDPFNGKLTHHKGVDIAAPTGTPVKPVAPGTVIFSGWKGGYGNTVILEHDDGMVTVYAHHSSNSVREGDQVDQTSVIALTGSTGRSTGPHLHFEAWRSGTNMTSDFMPGSRQSSSAARIANAPIRRFLQNDGTLLFTNLR